MFRGVMLLLGLGLLLCVLLLNLPSSERDFRAARYSQIVNELYINNAENTRQILALEDGGARGDTQITYRPPAPPGPATPGARLSPEEQRQKELADVVDWYYRNSYLKGDVQRFNEGAPEGRMLFELSKAQLARINPAAHTFRPTLRAHGRWVGRLFYASEGKADRSLTLRSLEQTGETIDLQPLARGFNEEPPSRHGRVTLFERKPAGRAAEKLEDTRVSGSIIHFLTADRREVAHIWAMGNGALLRLMAPEGDVHVAVRIDGRALHGIGGEVFAVSHDSVILFENHRPQARNRQRERRSSAWIVHDAVGPDVVYDGRSGLWQRSPYDPLLPRLQRVLSDIAASREGDVDADVRLTLLRSAEDSAGRILVSAMSGPRLGGGTGTEPAAITLMDGIDGRLLALPSWPLGAATQGTPGQPAPEDEPNQNFTRHATGSVAKVLFAPAVLDRNPELLSLKLPAEDASRCEGNKCRFESVLGLPLRRKVQDDAPQANLDFVTAVALSSNRYAVTLLTLGSGKPGMTSQGSQEIADPSDRYYIDSRLMDHRPSNLVFNPGAPDSLGILDLPWVDRMQHLLDVNVATPKGADRITRQYIWSALPRAVQPREPQRRMLDAISPEYENLRLETIHNVSGDLGSKYASLTLGAGESRWTNVALAEAVATLIRNRQVRAQLVVPPEDGGDPAVSGPPPFEGFQQLSGPVHQKLGDAMAAVVHMPGATTHEVNSTWATLARAACQRNEAFALFAKTGTPGLVEQHEAPESALFNEMARDQLFRVNKAGEILYKGLATPENPEGRVLAYKDLSELRRLRDRGSGPVFEHYNDYFQPRRQSAAVKADLAACHEPGRAPQALWTRVMRMVAESNEAPEYSQIRVDGPVISFNHMCSTTRPTRDINGKGDANINGRHLVMYAATYPRDAVIGGGTSDCNGGGAPTIDVSHQPTHAMSIVVAIADPERMGKMFTIAKQLLMGPVASHLGLQTPDGSMTGGAPAMQGRAGNGVQRSPQAGT